MNTTPQSSVSPIADLPRRADEHFRLALFAVVAHLIEIWGDGKPAEVLARYPFLQDYADEISASLGRADWSATDWRAALRSWELGQTDLAGELPLHLLAAAGLSPLELELLLAVGLPEEDPRFSELFERTTGRDGHPTTGLLLAWWRDAEDGGDRVEAVRQALMRLVRQGLIRPLNPDAPRSEWALAVAEPLWDSLRGARPEVPWLGIEPPDRLTPLDAYVAAPDVLAACRGLPELLRRHPAQVLAIRGPGHNGRKTLAGAVARALGKTLLVAGPQVPEDPRLWPLLGALAVTLDALPVVELQIPPGEARRLPPLPLHRGPVIVVTGRQGGIQVEGSATLLTLPLPMPDPDCRRLHWHTAAPDQPAAALEALVQTARLTSGGIRRLAVAASNGARLAGRAIIAPEDLKLACRGLQGSRLETLATRLETRGDLDDLALDEQTRDDLRTLVARCRHREALSERFGQGADSGVRALLSGPSGTGKTLAARLLAARLGKDLYRVDLAATVNKYLGETEKNLEHALAAAEELDAILLLDEGDALMAARTDVGSSNDRYANLETNFLLQRIETFEGILLVTTNAAERIDKAFSRRMDMVIPFRAPDDWQRWQILTMHLAAPWLDDALLQEIASRCSLTGGQLRNIAQHAQLLALETGDPLTESHLLRALEREYRKTGARSPIKPFTGGDAPVELTAWR